MIGLSKTQTVSDSPSSPSEFKVSYGYQLGYLSDIKYPSGLQVHYRLQSGQVVGVDVQEASSPRSSPRPVLPFVNGITYTAWLQPQSWIWGNGDTASRSFDREGRMTANEFASYGYDAAGRVTTVTQNLWYDASGSGSGGPRSAPFTWNATYDNRGRIVGFARDGASSAFTYDANSNRLTSIESASSDTDFNGNVEDDGSPKTETRTLNVDAASNRLLGFRQSTTVTRDDRSRSTANTSISYSADANGALTSDGLRSFEYDEFARLSKVRTVKDGDDASTAYLTNALGQRVFKGEATAEHAAPNADILGDGFIAWLKSQFGWLFTHGGSTSIVGTSFVYGDGQLPGWALLGEYDNGSASGKTRTEYIWIPTSDGAAIPIGMYRGGKFYAIHTDHLGTPRLMTNDSRTPVWQWPYSAFGTTKPTGLLTEKRGGKGAGNSEPLSFRATTATELNLRFPGQYFDEELGTFYNMQRDAMDPAVGRYRQPDPVGISGGVNRFGFVEGNPLSLIDPEGQMGQGSGANAPGPRPAAGGNLSVGIGGSLHTLLGVGLGADAGAVFDTSGNACFYSNICYTVGPGMSASGGVVTAVGSGLLSSGVTQYSGACWSGGTGLGGSASVLSGSDGSAQMGRSVFGADVGGSATYQSCRLELKCIRN
jgi:RHS repeat-associated protein